MHHTQDKKISTNLRLKKEDTSQNENKYKDGHVVCLGCGIIIYRPQSRIVSHNFHNQECFKDFCRKNPERPWGKDVYLKNSGENNHNYRDIMVSCSALHKWVSYHKGKPESCVDCGATKMEKFLEWSNQSGLYFRDLNDFVGRCQTCHKAHDTELGYPRKKSYDKQGRRIGITLIVPEEYLVREVQNRRELFSNY